MEAPEQDLEVAELIALFGGDESTLQEEDYEWDNLRARYDPRDDNDEIPVDLHLGSTNHPFAKDDIKYRFDVCSFAMGNMDGKQLQFYEVCLASIWRVVY